MRFLVIGSNTSLGKKVVKELKSRDYNDVLEYDKEQNFDNEKHAHSCIFYSEPDIVLYLADYKGNDIKKSKKINFISAKNVASECKKVGAKLIYLSTPEVFNPFKNNSHKEEDTYEPSTLYGENKFCGEMYSLSNPKTFIVRTSCIIDESDSFKEEISNKNGNDIVSITYSNDLAKLLIDMSLTEKYGIYHVTNQGSLSINKLNEYINKIYGINLEVSSDAPTKNYTLSSEKLVKNGLYLLPSYEDALDRLDHEIKKKLLLK